MDNIKKHLQKITDKLDKLDSKNTKGCIIILTDKTSSDDDIVKYLMVVYDRHNKNIYQKQIEGAPRIAVEYLKNNYTDNISVECLDVINNNLCYGCLDESPKIVISNYTSSDETPKIPYFL